MSNESNILIIDDDETILDSMTQVFSKEGYCTKTAGNGDQGIRILKENEPDLVFVDLKMPGKGGIEVLEEIKEFDPDCVAIVITGFGTIQSAVEAMKHGAYDFLPKPFTPDELRFIVKRGLERRRYIQETAHLRKEREMMRKNFISLVTHELRSPLAAVQQNLTVITGGMAGTIPEKALHILQRMSIRIKGLISLINDWLDFSRIESGEIVKEMSDVDIKELLHEVLDSLQPLSNEKKVSIFFKEPADYPPVRGNRETLLMLFMNLAHNAIKYNKEGGEVKIILEPGMSGTKVTVSDTGIGIPEKSLPLIFEQFYRVKDGTNVSGTGLGLSLVKKIVEAHSGNIEVRSEVGKGTVFEVHLP